MSTSALVKLAVGVAVALIGPLVARAWSRAADRPPVFEDGLLRLRPAGAAVFTFGALAVTAGVGAAMIGSVLHPDMPPWFAALAWSFVGFLAVVAVYAVMLVTERVELDGEGLRARHALRGWRALSWDEVTRVDFSRYWGRFSVRDRGGRHVAVSRWLPGYAALGMMARERLPEGVVTPAAMAAFGHFDGPEE